MATHKAKVQRGKVSYLAGHAAEDAVARHYLSRGHGITAMNWRGKAGEIDIIAREGNAIIFIEVKKAPSHATAAERLSTGQMSRIYLAASEFLGTQPLGSLTESRFDVALVDDVGRIEILENAFTA